MWFSTLTAHDAGTVKLFIYGYFGAGNMGDELILTAFLTMLDSLAGETKFEAVIAVDDLMLYDAGHYEKRYSAIKISFIKRSRIPFSLINLKAFTNCGAFIMPGGGIFQDYNPLSFLCYYSFILSAKIFGLKNYLLYQGLTGMRSNLLRKAFSTAVLFLVDYINVRDRESAAALPLKIRKHIDEKGFCDSVFALRSLVGNAVFLKSSGSNDSMVKSAETDINLDVPMTAGFSLRPWKGFEPRAAARALLSFSMQSGYKIKLYSMQKKIDCDFNNAIIEAAGENGVNVISFDGYYDDPALLCSELAKNAINAGMRFHFSILSMCAGGVSIGLSYDDKVAGLYDSCNLQQLCIRGGEFDEFISGNSAGLLLRLKYAEINKIKIKKIISAYCAECEERAVKIFKEFYIKYLKKINSERR